MKLSDEVGKVYSRLTVLERAPNRGQETRYRCRCACGNETVVDRKPLVYGRTRSCGCLAREEAKARMIQHGKTDTPEWRAWSAMRNRCRNPRDRNWSRYGGRGIRVAPEWDSFERFLADMGPRPGPQYSVGRIDNDGHYEPKNCRWESPAEQARNRKSSRKLTYRGETRTLAEWSTIVGKPYSRLERRLNLLGWSVEETLER